MNTKPRLILTAILLGISAVVLVMVCTQRGAETAPTATTPPNSVTVEPMVSSTPLSSPTPFPTPYSTAMVSHHPTELPSSYFDLTVAITATATEAEVGDTITVTIMITNTGELCAHQTLCELRGWLEDETTPHDYLEGPIFEPAYPGTITFEMGRSNCPGDFITCTYVLQAVRPGTVLLKGGFLGKVYFSTAYDRDAGGESMPLTLQVGPDQ